MKHKSLKVGALVSTLIISMVLVSCGKDKSSIPIKEGDYYKVTFFNGYPGGGFFTEKVDAGKTVSAPTTPSRDGYTFGGWTTDYEGKETFNFNSEITENIQIYAQWIKNVNVVTFKFNTDQADSIVNVEVGSKVSAPTVGDRDGYEFTGWYLDALCTEPYDFSKVVDGDLILYCGWVRSAISITFNLNYTGASAPISVNAALNKEVSVPSELSLERYLYAFAGWYTKAFPGATDEPVDLSAGFDDDVTLYAKWTRAYYEVTFKSGISGIEDSVITVPVENPIASAPAFVREGYTLDSKWYRDAELSVEANLNNITDDVILYAKWNINHYTVSFDLNYLDASGAPADQDITYQGNVTRPENPTRDGFTFLGWFVGAGDEAPEFNVASDQITKDTILYAHWAEVVSGKVKVTFTYIREAATVKHYELEVDNGSAVTSAKMPSNPSFPYSHEDSESYIFVGWYNDAAFTTAYDPNRILTQDTTIYGRILKRNTFEAELIDLTDKHGVGSSVELPEEGMIFGYEKIGDASNEGVNWVSGDYYIAGMYYTGMSIEFKIFAEVDLDNLAFGMRVSSEFHELMFDPLTPETFGVIVNGVDFEYEIPLDLPEPNIDPNVVNDPAGEKTPFEDRIISYHFGLKEGWNTIKFEVRNFYDYGGGTFKANAPMIDCIYIYANEDVYLEMEEHYEFLEKKINGGN